MSKTNSRKSKRKINILINLINIFNKYYDKNISPEDRTNQLKLILDKNNMSIASNEVNEIKILKRLYDETNSNVIKNDFYNELLSIRKYPYSNFNNFIFSKLPIQLKKSVKLVRFSTISNLVNNNIKTDIKTNIQIRNSGKDIPIDIVGFHLPSAKSKNINIHYNISIDNIRDKINKLFFNKLNESHYFLFYENMSKNNIYNLFKIILNIYIENILKKINNEIFNKNLEQSLAIINKINYTNYINLKIKKLLLPKIFNKFSKNVKYIIDKNEKNWIVFNSEKIKTIYLKNKLHTKKYCQHIYDLKNLKNTYNVDIDLHYK